MATSSQIYTKPAMRIQMEELSGLPTELETELALGRPVELARGTEVIAEMRAPKLERGSEEPLVTATTFDWEAQRRQMWGDRVLKAKTTQWIREDRDARG